MRQYEPKVLMATGMSEPVTFWKRRAFPPREAAGERSSSLWGWGAGDLPTRSAMAAISSLGSTGAEIFESSPSRSRRERKSEKVSVVVGIFIRVREGGVAFQHLGEEG